VASDTNSIAATIPEGEFRRATLIFDTGTTNAELGQALGVRLVNLKMPGTTNAPNIEVDFDEVRLSAGTVPVAATLAISLVGLQVNILVLGTAGATYRVEYSGVLPAVNWAPLTNVTLATSSYTALDVHVVTNSENRFYRAVLIE
jgi:hypothetical protein